MNAPNGINMKTTAGGMVLDSLTDISMKTTKKVSIKMHVGIFTKSHLH